MYSLTLTKDEREAFDWVGDRYLSSGHEMAELIQKGMPSESSWDDVGDITFSIPEHVAWEMRKLAAVEESEFACFADSLANKLWDFLYSIV